MRNPPISTARNPGHPRASKQPRAIHGPYRDVIRARIVLAAAAGHANAEIARELRVCEDTARG